MKYIQEEQLMFIVISAIVGFVARYAFDRVNRKVIYLKRKVNHQTVAIAHKDQFWVELRFFTMRKRLHM